MVEDAVRRWDVVGEWSLKVKIEVHQVRMVRVLGRSWGWLLAVWFRVVGEMAV